MTRRDSKQLSFHCLNVARSGCEMAKMKQKELDSLPLFEEQSKVSCCKEGSNTRCKFNAYESIRLCCWSLQQSR